MSWPDTKRCNKTSITVELAGSCSERRRLIWWAIAFQCSTFKFCSNENATLKTAFSPPSDYLLIFWAPSLFRLKCPLSHTQWLQMDRLLPQKWQNSMQLTCFIPFLVLDKLNGGAVLQSLAAFPHRCETLGLTGVKPWGWGASHACSPHVVWALWLPPTFQRNAFGG